MPRAIVARQLGHVFLGGLVERQPPGLDQGHHRGRGHRLGDRGEQEDGPGARASRRPAGRWSCPGLHVQHRRLHLPGGHRLVDESVGGLQRFFHRASWVAPGGRLAASPWRAGAASRPRRKRRRVGVQSRGMLEPDRGRPLERKKKDEVLQVAGREVVISNPDKIYFPQAGYTKLRLVQYYLDVADAARCAANGNRPHRAAPVRRRRRAAGLLPEAGPRQATRLDRHGDHLVSLGAHRDRGGAARRRPAGLGGQPRLHRAAPPRHPGQRPRPPRRAAHRPRPLARRRLGRGPAGGAAEPGGAGRARAGVVSQDLRLARHAPQRAHPPALELRAGAAGGPGGGARGGAAGARRWPPAPGGRRSGKASSSTTTRTPRTAPPPAPTRCARCPTRGCPRR